jgi:hypothetical protein
MRANQITHTAGYAIGLLISVPLAMLAIPWIIWSGLWAARRASNEQGSAVVDVSD